MKNPLSISTLSVLLICTLLTACGNSGEEVPKSAPIASKPVTPTPVKNEADTEETAVVSNDELEKLMKEFESEAEVKQQKPVKPKITPTTQPKIKSSPKVTSSEASHDRLTHDEIESHEFDVGIRCRMKAGNKLNLSMFGYSDEDENKNATYIGNNTYRLQASSVIFGTEDRVEFVCESVASGDTFIPDWDIDVRKVN